MVQAQHMIQQYHIIRLLKNNSLTFKIFFQHVSAHLASASDCKMIHMSPTDLCITGDGCLQCRSSPPSVFSRSAVPSSRIPQNTITLFESWRKRKWTVRKRSILGVRNMKIKTHAFGFPMCVRGRHIYI